MAATMCNVCGKRRGKTGSKGTETSPHRDMCNYCYEEGGWENAHSDYDHEGLNAGTIEYGMTTHKTRAEFEAWLADEKEGAKGCWICHPELNLAQKPAKAASTGPKKQGVRRPQFNHKGHSHPQTPAARRACKEAFWAQTTVNSYSADQLVAAQAEWNYQCDGHGKPLPEAKKVGWAGVAPLGPKGGTGASLKAAGEKAMSLNLKTGKVK